MAEGVKDKVGELAERAKGAVSGGGAPIAKDGEGRVGIVREALKRLGDGDHDGFLEHIVEDAEWENPEGSHFPGPGSLSGHDGLRDKFIADVERSFVSFGFRPAQYLEAEDRDTVIVLGDFIGQGVKDENEFEIAGVQVWEFERGQVARVHVIADSAAFPDPVTKEEVEEREKEEKEGDEDQQGKETEGKGESDASGEDESGSAGADEDHDEDEAVEGQRGSEHDDADASGGDEPSASEKEQRADG